MKKDMAGRRFRSLEAPAHCPGSSLKLGPPDLPVCPPKDGPAASLGPTHPLRAATYTI